MVLWHRLLTYAAQQLATNPRARAKAAKMAKVVEAEVKPRARAALEQARPRLDAAREELRAAAEEADPRKDPRGFAAALKRRHKERGKSG